jgi:hypothetical protein
VWKRRSIARARRGWWPARASALVVDILVEGPGIGAPHVVEGHLSAIRQIVARSRPGVPET